MNIIIFLVVLTWLAIQIFGGYAGWNITLPGQIPTVIIASIFIPTVIFLCLYFFLPSFRKWMLSKDLRLITLFQSWRVAGVMFLVLYSYEILPKEFAWTAALGDVLIGVLAPFVALAIIDNPKFQKSVWFIGYHILGILDFVIVLTVALIITGAMSNIFPIIRDNSAMTVLPLSIIPTFLVPLWIILHLIAILKTFSGQKQNL